MLTIDNQSRDSRSIAKGTIVRIDFWDVEDILPLIFFGRWWRTMFSGALGVISPTVNRDQTSKTLSVDAFQPETCLNPWKPPTFEDVAPEREL